MKFLERPDVKKYKSSQRLVVWGGGMECEQGLPFPLQVKDATDKLIWVTK